MNWYQTDSTEDRYERLWACQSPERKFEDMRERVESVKSFQEIQNEKSNPLEVPALR